MNKPRAKRSENWPWQVGEGSKAVRAENITRDEAFQVRAKSIPALAKKYSDDMACGQQFPPLLLAEIKGRLYLIEGWHRFEAAHLRLGHDAVEAVVKPMTHKEAKAVASQANATQGQGLSSADKRRRLSLHIEAGLHKKGGEIVQTYGDLVRILGIKKTTLYRYMEKDHPVTFMAMQKEGGQARDSGPPEIDHDPENIRRAQQALRDALTYCDALCDPEKRQDIINEAAGVIEQMKLKEHHEFQW